MPSNGILREFDRLTMRTSRSSSVTPCPFSVRDEGVKRLMTIPGSTWWWRRRGCQIAGTLEQSQKLVFTFGPQPECAPIGSWARVSRPDHEAGPWAAAARGMLVEAAWAAARAPGPSWCALPAEVRARRGQHVAAVATARKLAVLIWHLLSKGESYVWARPALHARKLRDLELKAGYKAARGQRGAAHAYNIKSHRDQERRWVEQAETAYARFVSGWNPRGPKRVRTGAATEVRR